jgi:hypothetical protein
MYVCEIHVNHINHDYNNGDECAHAAGKFHTAAIVTTMYIIQMYILLLYYYDNVRVMSQTERGRMRTDPLYVSNPENAKKKIEKQTNAGENRSTHRSCYI